MVNLLRTISKNYKSVNICDICRSPGAVYVCHGATSLAPYALCNKQVCYECGYQDVGRVQLCLPHRVKRQLGKVMVKNVKDFPFYSDAAITYVAGGDSRCYYIGRRIRTEKYDLRESVFANRKLKKGASDLEKIKNLARYLGKLRYEIKTHGFMWADLHEMKSHILSGDNVVLLCWCAPSTCHGDLIKKVLLEIVEEACLKANP